MDVLCGELWGARDVHDVGGGVLNPTLARDGLEVLLHHALDSLLCRDAVDGGPGRGGSVSGVSCT